MILSNVLFARKIIRVLNTDGEEPMAAGADVLCAAAAASIILKEL